MDPRDEEVNFHRKATFGELVLLPRGAKKRKPKKPTVRCEWGGAGMKVKVV